MFSRITNRRKSILAAHPELNCMTITAEIAALVRNAEEYASSLPEGFELPTLEEYISGLKSFLESSQDWCGLEDSHFYSVSGRMGYYESSDNAYGGLDVSWAFHRSPSLHEVINTYIQLVEVDRANYLEDLEEENA